MSVSVIATGIQYAIIGAFREVDIYGNGIAEAGRKK